MFRALAIIKVPWRLNEARHNPNRSAPGCRSGSAHLNLQKAEVMNSATNRVKESLIFFSRLLRQSNGRSRAACLSCCYLCPLLPLHLRASPAAQRPTSHRGREVLVSREFPLKEDKEEEEKRGDIYFPISWATSRGRAPPIITVCTFRAVIPSGRLKRTRALLDCKCAL